jgi:hypothetical protein
METIYTELSEKAHSHINQRRLDGNVWSALTEAYEFMLGMVRREIDRQVDARGQLRCSNCGSSDIVDPNSRRVEGSQAGTVPVVGSTGEDSSLKQ